MKKRVSGIISLVLALVLLVSLSACGNQNSGQTSGAETVSAETATLEETDAPETETVSSVPEDVSSAVSNISSVGGVPLITLSNGVQVPQLGLGTQIQSLERDSSESGRKLLNDTSHDAVVAALQAGYRHLDTAHGYFNETGVGQGIIDSGIPREEIWVTSKLWPSEFGEGVTAKAIDDMLEKAQREKFLQKAAEDLIDEENEKLKKLLALQNHMS